MEGLCEADACLSKAFVFLCLAFDKVLLLSDACRVRQKGMLTAIGFENVRMAREVNLRASDMLPDQELGCIQVSQLH